MAKQRHSLVQTDAQESIPVIVDKGPGFCWADALKNLYSTEEQGITY